MYSARSYPLPCEMCFMISRSFQAQLLSRCWCNQQTLVFRWRMAVDSRVSISTKGFSCVELLATRLVLLFIFPLEASLLSVTAAGQEKRSPTAWHCFNRYASCFHFQVLWNRCSGWERIALCFKDTYLDEWRRQLSNSTYFAARWREGFRYRLFHSARWGRRVASLTGLVCCFSLEVPFLVLCVLLLQVLEDYSCARCFRTEQENCFESRFVLPSRPMNRPWYRVGYFLFAYSYALRLPVQAVAGSNQCASQVQENA